jgi:alkylated DNA repair dioxygenase AlkB
MLPLLKTEIKTPKSFLNIYSFEDDELLNNCISDVKDKLSQTYNRRVGFFSNKFNGNYLHGKMCVAKSKPLPESLSTLLDMINEIFETDYNGILVNEYEDGNQFISRHRDSQNHPKNGVLIISYGATRTFRVYDNNIKQIKEIPLVHGQVLHMSENFQKEFEHDLKKEPDIKERRYSLNFHKYMNLGLTSPA